MNLGSKFSFGYSESVNSSVTKDTSTGKGKNQKQTKPISAISSLYAFLYIHTMTLYYPILVLDFF